MLRPIFPHVNHLGDTIVKSPRGVHPVNDGLEGGVIPGSRSG